MPTVNDSASGASYAFGSAAAATGYPSNLTASGASQSLGDATIATELPLASLTDFGIWDVAGVDPAISCLLAGTSLNGTRAFAAAYAPVTYTTALGTLWNGAAFAAVRATWYSALATAITAAQFEATATGNLLSADASDYRNALVYSRNAVVSTTTVYDASVERSQDMPLTGAWSGKLTNNGALSPYSMQASTAAMASAAPGQSFTASVNVALPRAGAQWTAAIFFYDSSYNTVGSTTGYSTALSTHPGGYAYQKSTAAATAPSGTAWVAVVPQITPAAIGDGEIAYVAVHRISCTNLSARIAPAPYQSARQQNITVTANRVNQVYNPGFDNDVWGWYLAGAGAGATFTSDGTVGRTRPGAAKVYAPYVSGTAAPGMGTAGQPSPGMALLKPGRTYTMSAYVQPQAANPPVYLLAAVGGRTYAYGNSTATTPILDDGWYRLWVTFTIPQTASGAVGVSLYMNQGDWDAHASTACWWVDDVLVDESPALNGYFDGAEPMPDYLWEGAPYRSRSHYYRDFRSLQYRLNGLVGQSVPLGVPYQLLYAQPDS